MDAILKAKIALEAPRKARRRRLRVAAPASGWRASKLRQWLRKHAEEPFRAASTRSWLDMFVARMCPKRV
jgi:hypothetical protein